MLDTPLLLFPRWILLWNGWERRGEGGRRGKGGEGGDLKILKGGRLAITFSEIEHDAA